MAYYNQKIKGSPYLFYSDENYTISSNDIVRHLKEYGVNAERKVIYTDIAILNKFGMDIETVPNVGCYVNYYFLWR